MLATACTLAATISSALGSGSFVILTPMKNDFKLLPLQHLAQEYRETYAAMVGDELNIAKAAARRTYERRFEQTMSRLQGYNSEAGSDGLEEEAYELIGEFQEPKSLEPEVAARLREEAIDNTLPQWIEREGISQKLSWLPQQMMAYFGSWEAVRVDGVYSPALTVKRNTQERNDLFAMGAMLLAKAKRSELFKGAPKGSQQYKSPINPLVPIILAGFKRYQNIPYEAWNKSEIASIVDPEIAQLVFCKVPDLTNSDILGFRNTALTPKQGPRAGKCNNPATTAALYHLQETSIGHLPKLAKHMVLQTWAAHPQNRDPYAILDPENWDRVPEPLVEGTDLFMPQEPVSRVKFVTSKSTDTDMPWL